jgi:hypothetical protein
MNIITPLLKQFQVNKWFKPVGCIEGEYSKTITLPVSSTAIGQQLYFNSDTELDNAVIKTIELVVNQNSAITQYQNLNLDTISQLLSSRAILTLSNNAREVISQMPLSSLVRSYNNGKPAFFLLSDIVWQNCYVELVDNTGYATTNGFFFRVTYDRKS